MACVLRISSGENELYKRTVTEQNGRTKASRRERVPHRVKRSASFSHFGRVAIDALDSISPTNGSERWTRLDRWCYRACTERWHHGMWLLQPCRAGIARTNPATPSPPIA